MKSIFDIHLWSKQTSLNIVLDRLMVEEVYSLTAHSKSLVTHDGNVLHIEPCRVLEKGGHLIQVGPFVLDHDALGTKEQRQSLKHVQMIRYAQGRNGLRQVDEDKVKRTKVLSGQQFQALDGISEPPLDSLILKMRLRMKVFERVPYDHLIELEPNDKLERRIFEGLGKDHGITSSNKEHSANRVDVSSRNVNDQFVIMWSVLGTCLNGKIDLQANIAIGHVKEEHFLVERFGFLESFPAIHLQHFRVIACCSIFDGRNLVKAEIRFNFIQRFVKIQGRSFHIIAIIRPFLFPNHMLEGIDQGIGVLPNCIPLILRNISIGRRSWRCSSLHFFHLL